VTAFANSERHQLADLLLRVGPDEPTLCVGWTTRDLAAHLVVRERRPDAAAGMLLPPLRGHGERVRLAKAAEPFERIVEQVRNPPWWSPVSNPLTDELANAGEFFIHHEDVRRAGAGWEPRDLTREHDAALWRGARFAGKMALRRVGDDPQVTLRGSAGELALFLSGRQGAARVEIDGPDPGLREARLGL
jgi:uncharacterized protein (TIGR03085 family)